jgi:hypothetical protein
MLHRVRVSHNIYPRGCLLNPSGFEYAQWRGVAMLVLEQGVSQLDCNQGCDVLLRKKCMQAYCDVAGPVAYIGTG